MPPPDVPVGRSNLPVPSSSRGGLTQSAGRASMAGRPSIAAALKTPYQGHHGPRQSLMRSGPVPNPLLASASKQLGRTPMSGNRRTSLWPGATGAGAAPQPTKDPRPLRDKAYQAAMRQDILAFLQANGFDVNMSTLTNIQAKDYRVLFDYLICTWDERAMDGTEDKKLEQYFKETLTAFRYPFVAQIDVKWLVAPASMHSWPTLLGVLHWLVKTCGVLDIYEASGHPTLQIIEDISEDSDRPLDEKALSFEYYSNAYMLWLDHKDDLAESAKDFLQERFNRRNERLQVDIDENRRQLDEVKIQLAKVQAKKSNLANLEEDKQTCALDCEKYESYIKYNEDKRPKLLDFITSAKADIQRKEEILAQVNSELRRLDTVVKEQNITPEEAHRMTSQHDTLARNLADSKQKRDDLRRAGENLEVQMARRAEEAEDEIERYRGMLSTLNMLPPLPPPFEDVDLTLELNTAASDPALLLIGEEIKTFIRPKLALMAEHQRSERTDAENARLQVDKELNRIGLEYDRVEEEAEAIERRAQAVNRQADDLRDTAFQESLVAQQEIERTERELANARKDAQAHGFSEKTVLQSAQFEYEECAAKVARLREQTIKDVLRSSDELTSIKNAMSQHVIELADFVGSNKDK
ncbi:hypothetical protein CYLTODRAFT_421717 [Cylindrobasidium torrendii FP15055 ss-10]|uniref:Kinetochore protein NDC80 n=1 Tax=Cylindrobasidium torrendii FP15055 ss-10 TaxID=1314674 RepID=A0A0D7BDM7_9AGAR|nr:hypothetical protein CYLTODRAFT_421717 [Cylindrobasidium torrendii FP15055 ss-10]